MQIVLTRTRDGEALSIASNTGSLTMIQAEYRRRFYIECLFRTLKTEGFNFKNTPTTLHNHVERLRILTIACVWCDLKLGSCRSPTSNRTVDVPGVW